MTDGGLAAGLRLAVTTFTVVPLRPGPVDRRAASVAMALAPALGAALGAAAGSAVLGVAALGTPPLLAGVIGVAAGALLTRGLHLDGLADTVDALGSYRSGEAALAIMRKPDVGPFGVTALVLVLLAQAAALAALVERAWPAAVVTAARPEGLGATVAGTVGAPSLAVATAAVAALAVAAVPGRAWQGPVAVLAALAVAVLLLRHVVRRFGGITGDVLGAAVETTTTLAYVGLLLGGV